MVISFVKRVLKYSKTARNILMALLNKNLLARSAILKITLFALFSILNILMAKSIEVVLSMLLYLLIIGSSINRDALYFKAVYSLRIKSERYNSRFKALDFEKAYVKNINSVTNFNTFGHITLFTVAIVAIKLGKFDKFKSLSSLMQSA
jgi:hypothetical protein